MLLWDGASKGAEVGVQLVGLTVAGRRGDPHRAQTPGRPARTSIAAQTSALPREITPDEESVLRRIQDPAARAMYRERLRRGVDVAETFTDAAGLARIRPRLPDNDPRAPL